MKHASLIFAALSALMLAACGGNGGTYQGTFPDHAAKPTVTDTANHGNTADGATGSHADTAKSNRIGGHYGVLTEREIKNSDGSVTEINDEFREGKMDTANGKLDVLSINGQTFALLPDPSAEISNKDSDFYQWEDSKKVEEAGIIGKHLKHARYGILGVQPADRDDLYYTYYFAQGEPATHLPVADKVIRYQGRAVTLTEDDELMGTSSFNVNFGKKTLDGIVSFGGKEPDVKLKAEITGNRFRSPATEAIVTEGGFFGAQAAELAGTYWRKDNPKEGGISGAFGASKQ